MKFNRHLHSVWLVGGSGRLGLSIADRLEPGYNVVNLSRSDAKANSKRFFNVSIDLSDISRVKTTIKSLLSADSPRALVFCQRYRPSPSNDDVDILSGVNTEIISTQNIIEEFAIGKPEGKRSVVVISSVNGALVNRCLPFWYHWLKASQIHLVKYFAVKNGGLEMNVNCIAAGSFLKDDINTYPVQQKSWLEKLGRSTPVMANTKVHDIAALVEFLISDEAAMINGQVVTVDGGITNILQETLI